MARLPGIAELSPNGLSLLIQRQNEDPPSKPERVEHAPCFVIVYVARSGARGKTYTARNETVLHLPALII